MTKEKTKTKPKTPFEDFAEAFNRCAKGSSRQVQALVKSHGFQHIVVEPVAPHSPRFRLAFHEGVTDKQARTAWNWLAKAQRASYPARVVSSNGAQRFSVLPLDDQEKKWMAWRDGEDATTVLSLDDARSVFHRVSRGRALA